MGLDFSNTEIAFRAKTNRELVRSYLLFWILAKTWIVRVSQWIVVFSLKIRLPIQWIIRATVFGQFCGGESIHECKKAIDKLGAFGVGAILDFAAEGSQSERNFDRTLNELQRNVDLASVTPEIPFCVFKVTGLMSQQLLEAGDTNSAEWDRGVQRVDQVFHLAHDKQVRVFIDAEESWFQNSIDQIAMEMILRYNKERVIAYNTIQLYRKDGLELLRAQLEKAQQGGCWYGVKLVRGAYMEKERLHAERLRVASPICESKKQTDLNFDKGLEYCVSHREKLALCAGSHNESSIRFLTELMKENDIKKNDSRFHFSQLYGMSDNLSFNLAAGGYNVSKYIPYGPVGTLIPYLFRRAQENSSVAGQTGRELMLITAERRRRRA